MALTTNLVAYWKLDGNSNDAVGSNNGTDTGITYSSGNGKIVQGAGFASGSSSKIIFANAVSGSGDYSWQFWLKHTSTETSMMLFSQAFAGSYFFAQINGGSGPAKFQFADSGDVSFSTSGTPDLHDGGWHHVVITKSNLTWVVYVDGAVDTNFTATINTSYSANALNFGTYGGGTGNFYTGALDEFGIWSRALTSTEVSQLYNGGAGLAYPLSTTAIKTINGLAKASVKTVNGLAIASVKTWNGLA